MPTTDLQRITQSWILQLLNQCQLHSEHPSVWVICRNLPPHLDAIWASQLLVRVYMVSSGADGRSGGNYIWEEQRQGCTEAPLGKSRACWNSFYLYECVSSHKKSIFYIDLWSFAKRRRYKVFFIMCFGQTIVLKVKKIYLVIEQVILVKTENQQFFHQYDFHF